MTVSRMKSRPRRSLLYIPGNNPGMLQNCAIYGSDGVLLDLEDSISISEKDAARTLVRHALLALDFGSVEKVVRINGRDTPYFEADLAQIIPAWPDAIRLPKVDSAQDVLEADHIISALEAKAGIPQGSVGIQAMLETARAIVQVNEIAAASPRLVGLTLGGQDLAADLGIKATKEGLELLYAKSAVVIAAKAFGLEAFDTVFTDVADLAGLAQASAVSVSLGFSGKAAIHPSQIPVIHAAFAPSSKEIEKAVRILELARLAGLEVPEL
ncbi:MAG: Citrate (Pro-3S)-lyase [Spirochaetes bacterium]|nr:MAG: Citrate (Pro-3S)-lyase [Spirochaetota bacterium]